MFWIYRFWKLGAILVSSVSFHAAGPKFLHLFLGRHLQRANDSESDKLRIRKIPDTLRQLRVLHLPGAVRTPPSGAAAPHGVIIPRPSADCERVRPGRPIPRIFYFCLAGGLRVKVWIILVDDPFSR